LRHSVIGIGWAAVFALPWVLLVALVTAALRADASSTVVLENLHALPQALWLPLWALALLGELAHPTGIGRSHFRWSAAHASRLRRASRLGAAAFALSGLLVELAWFGGDFGPAAYESRLFLILIWSSIGMLAWRLWAPLPGMVEGHSRGRIAMSLMLSVGALSIVACLVSGYQFIGLAIIQRVQQTAAIGVCALIIYGLAERWVRINQRRVAVAAAWLESLRARAPSRLYVMSFSKCGARVDVSAASFFVPASASEMFPAASAASTLPLSIDWIFAA